MIEHKLSGLLILFFVLLEKGSKTQKNTTTGLVLRPTTCMTYLKAPLMIWNGIEVNAFFSDTCALDSTAVVRILKGQEAVAAYGERARKGVIVYKTTMKAVQMGSLQRVSDQKENTSRLIIR